MRSAAVPKPRLHPSTPDTLGAQAKTALERVEALTTELETKTRMCREQWFAYGEALLAQQAVMPATRDFGAWIRKHKLDTGLAKSASVRSNAIWCAKFKAELQACKWLVSCHPTEMRRQFIAWSEAEARLERRILGGLPRGFMDPLRDLASGAGMAEGMCRWIERQSQVPEGAIEELSEYVQRCQQALNAAKAWLAENELPPEVYVPFHAVYT